MTPADLAQDARADTGSSWDLTLWVIYQNPIDYPGQFVGRRWTVGNRDGTGADAEPFAVAPRVEDVRAALPPGLYRLDRMPDDDAAIAEVWL